MGRAGRLIVAALGALLVFGGIPYLLIARPFDPPVPTVRPQTAIPLSSRPGYVSRTTMSDWPLTIDEGRVACERAQAVIFIAPDDRAYAVNAPAKGQAADRKWAAIETIAVPGASLDALIDAGLARCP